MKYYVGSIYVMNEYIVRIGFKVVYDFLCKFKGILDEFSFFS